MKHEFSEPEDSGHPGGGFGGFVRNLLSGIPWSERAESTDEFHLDAPERRMMRIDNSNGRTRILGEDRDDVHVTAKKVARAESEEEAGRLAEEIRVLTSDVAGVLSLEVDIPRRWNRRGRIDLDIRVPRDVRCEVLAANGKICAEGLRASIKVRSSNGVVRMHDLVGDIEVSTSNAKVSCSHTCGRLVARSSNGKIEIQDHKGSIDGATSNGVIRVSIEELAEEGVVLSTSNGTIVLELPEDIDADVDLRVDNGIIRNHRELCRCDRESGGRLRGVLGDGGTPIRLRTSNGSISLR